jgi:HlyD family secretion protein
MVLHRLSSVVYRSSPIIRPVRCLAVLLALAPLAGACIVAPSVERTTEKEAVRTARIQRGDITGVLSFNGEIRPKGQQILTSRLSGRLDKLYVDTGSVVQEDQPIAELDRPTFELRVVQSEAALATAEARLAGLLAGTHPDEAAHAEALLRAARARLDELEKTPRGNSPEQLLANLQVARQRVAQLELASLESIGRADFAVVEARARLDQLLAEPAPAQNQSAISEARRALRVAEESAVQARRGGASEELNRARLDLGEAQDQLILARNSVSQAEIEAARAAAQAAESGFKRASAPPSEVELKTAQANVQRALAELEVARLEARQATVEAPFNGIVNEVFVTPGALVAPGTPLLALIPPNFEIVVPLPESQIGQVSAGQPVKLAVEAYPNQDFSGAVKAVAPSVDPRSRSVVMRVEIADPGYKLKAGMFAQVALASPPKRGVLLVPREAIVGRSGENAVYLVADGRARRQVVQIGVTDGRSTEVLAGLSEGAEVVLTVSAQSDGAAVR